MTDSEKAAVAGAGLEGSRAFYMGLSHDNCPYPDIEGVIAEQRKAWLGAFDSAAGKD